MEPFNCTHAWIAAIWLKLKWGKAQAAQDFQDIPLSVKVADAARTSLGMYFKFCVDVSECASEETVTILLVYPLEHLETHPEMQ